MTEEQRNQQWIIKQMLMFTPGGARIVEQVAVPTDHVRSDAFAVEHFAALAAGALVAVKLHSARQQRLQQPKVRLQRTVCGENNAPELRELVSQVPSSALKVGFLRQALLLALKMRFCSRALCCSPKNMLFIVSCWLNRRFCCQSL